MTGGHRRRLDQTFDRRMADTQVQNHPSRSWKGVVDESCVDRTKHGRVVAVDLDHVAARAPRVSQEAVAGPLVPVHGPQRTIEHAAIALFDTADPEVEVAVIALEEPVD